MKNNKVSKIQSKLREGGFEGFLGHSFRVGGVSLRVALGIPIADVCKLGRWQSSCYKLYIRDYSSVDLKQSKRIIKELNDLWVEEDDDQMVCK
jgi:hypothetical protein